MQIFFSYYQLKKNSISNARTTSLVQKGALIKIVDNDGNFGVSDLCPWPNLGDLELEVEISERGPLFQRALMLAVADQQARIEQVQLVDRTEIENHFLVNDIQNFEAFAVEAAPIVKIKGLKDFTNTANWLTKNQLLLQKIRLDFNSCLTEAEFENFFNLLPTEILKKIELVEDPFPFDLQAWNKWNQKIKIAADFVDVEFKEKWSNKINKPARESFDSAAVYLTSSMDRWHCSWVAFRTEASE